MKFTREQAFAQWANKTFGPPPKSAPPQHERYATLFEAYTAGYEAALEAAALECEKYDSLRIDGAGETIRDLKDKP